MFYWSITQKEISQRLYRCPVEGHKEKSKYGKNDQDKKEKGISWILSQYDWFIEGSYEA